MRVRVRVGVRLQEGKHGRPFDPASCNLREGLVAAWTACFANVNACRHTEGA